MARSIQTQLVDSIPLPEGAEPPIVAYVSGAELTEGKGIRVRDNRIWFDQPLRIPHATSVGGKLMLMVGIGGYGDVKGDTLDLAFRRAGEAQWLTDIPLSATARPGD